MPIEPLDPKRHRRNEFTCGDDELDYFLKKHAQQHAEKGISRTFILTDTTKPGAILGFYTLAPCEIVLEDISHKDAKAIKGQKALFGIKLGRLAVKKEHQGKGLSKVLMHDAILRAVAASNEIGGTAFFVDAKSEGLAKYYEKFGFKRCCTERNQRLYIMMGTLRKAVAQAVT